MSAITSLEAQIVDGQHDDELGRIERAIATRKRRMFRPGTKVALVDPGNPEDGMEGSVIKVNVKRITCRFSNGRSYHVPVSMLRVLS